MIETDQVTFVNQVFPHYTISESAALLCEQLGHDELALQYATFIVTEYHDHTSMCASARLVLGRLCRKRGDEAGMLEQCRLVAADGLANYRPLLAIRAGCELGGEHGQRMVSEAAAAIGRPAAELRAEFEELAALT